MKPASFTCFFLVLAAPVSLWAQPACGDCDCSCEARCCAPASACETAVAVAIDDRADAVVELRRLVNRIIADAGVREQVLAVLARQPQDAYRHAALRTIAFSPADAATYAAIGRQLDS